MESAWKVLETSSLDKLSCETRFSAESAPLRALCASEGPGSPPIAFVHRQTERTRPSCREPSTDIAISNLVLRGHRLSSS